MKFLAGAATAFALVFVWGEVVEAVAPMVV